MEDLPTFEANPTNPVDPMVTDDSTDQSLLNFLDVIPSSSSLETTKPKETTHTNLESPHMNGEVVDHTMRDLDTFNRAPKPIQQSL